MDLSRKRLDYDLPCEDGSRIERCAVPPDADGLRGLVPAIWRPCFELRAERERAAI